MGSRTWCWVASLAVAGAVLAGCAPAGEPGAGAGVATTSSASPQGSRTPDEEPAAPSGAVNEDTGEIVGERAVPEWDDDARAAARRAASAAMTAFARPEVEYDAWWSELEPLLTYDAAVDYSHTDPANVPASKVTGPAVIVDEASAYLATVEVPTDVGVYTVLLVRADGDAPWLVERITPPEDEG